MSCMCISSSLVHVYFLCLLWLSILADDVHWSLSFMRDLHWFHTCRFDGVLHETASVSEGGGSCRASKDSLQTTGYLLFRGSAEAAAGGWRIPSVSGTARSSISTACFACRARPANACVSVCACICMSSNCLFFFYFSHDFQCAGLPRECFVVFSYSCHLLLCCDWDFLGSNPHQNNTVL